MVAANLDLSWTDGNTQTAFARLLARTSTHEPLAVLLHELLQFAERLTPDMRCSILLADLSAGVLRASAAPSLPAAYVRAIDQLPIMEGVGSCGTAAARRETVIVCDIAQSPLWLEYAALAAENGLGACWSVPLLDSADELLGTCAMYYAQPRTPTKAEADLIRISGGLAAMIIQRHRDTERVTVSEARYRLLAAELQQARSDLQAILDHVPARITSWNLDYTNQFSNRVAELQFGISPGTAVGKPVWELLGEERFAHAKPYIDAALAGEPQSHEPVEAQPDGSLRYSHVDYVPKRREGQVVGLYALATDVTELRNSYERIRELAQHVETVREEERRSIAHRLHEGIAQDLFAMKLGLDQLGKEAKGGAGVTPACQDLTAAMEKCMADTRQIANELLPAALGHLRLTTGLEEHARYFAALSGLQIHVTEIGPFPELDKATKVILFRAAQEALTNVVKHAQASCVSILLSADSVYVRMEITDNGSGIQGTALSKSGSLGLLGIHERITTLGGAVSIGKSESSGTTLAVNIPHSGSTIQR